MEPGEEPQRPVIVLDFGAQYAQLIARRVRECRVFSELLPYDTPLEELRARDPTGIVLSGGPASVYEPGAPDLDPGHVRARGAGAGHLLRDAGAWPARSAARSAARARRSSARPRWSSTAARCCSTSCAHDETCWMSHSDAVVRVPDGLPGHGVVAGRADRGHGGRRARHLRRAVPPRGGAHAARHGRAAQLPVPGLPGARDVDGAAGHRRAGRAHPRAGRRRAGHLRALRRRRLGGGGAARAPRGRRPADVRVRRPRAAARGRGRAGRRDVPRPLRGAARARRGAGALPGAARRASRIPRRSASASARRSSACSRRSRGASRACATWCRARSTRT